MSALISFYISVQVLLTLTLLILWCFRKSSIDYNFSSILKLGNGLIVLSVLLPVSYYFLPTDNPFGPIMEVWSESNTTVQSSHANQVNIRISSTRLTQALTWDGSVELGMGLIFLWAAYFIFGSLKIVRGYLELVKIVKTSFSFKQIGKTQLWLSDEVLAPFSFFNGKAHIVLPADLMMSPQKLQIAIAHEAQHHRQKDTLWIYFFEVIKLVFALNPFVKRLVEQTEELQELACDEALIGHKSFSPVQYSQCLYDFAEKQQLTSTRPIGAVGMAVEAKLLKRRIEIMFEHQRKTTQKAFIGVSLIGFLLMTGTAWALQGAVGNKKISMTQAQSLADKMSAGQKIPIVVDSAVLFWLNKAVETQKSRKYMRDSLGRMQTYEAMIESKFGSSSLPSELKAVPLVESGFRNDVKSTMLAAGIWQFIPTTARRCGLEVSENQDERLNPSRLTDAAVCYYQKLHAVFQDWHVAISAYNIGERSVMKAIADAGHNDVFKLAREGALGQEGQTYLPKVIAAMIILKNPELVE